MKRAEYIAWGVLGGLLAIFAMLLAGAIAYHYTAFWAGAMLVAGQGVGTALAIWGLRLARQAAELREYAPVGAQTAQAPQRGDSFRMSYGDERAGTGEASRETRAETLDTGFQRLCVGATGVVLVALAGIATWLAVVVYQWTTRNPEAPVPLVDLLPLDPTKYTAQTQQFMNELCLLIGLAAAGLYAVLFWIARPKRRGDLYGDAVYSMLTMGLCGMIALGAGTVLTYFKVAYASEVAALVVAFFMLLEGLELFINACRSYSSIEEIDQEATDLQALPLVPMLSSIWLGGLRMLLAQSVGLSGEAKHERGVIARMMPRALLAILVIAIGVSCLRVVNPGDVAILERLGYAATDQDGRPLATAILQPGLHVTMPWPIDQLVIIPRERLQMTDVGTELHASKAWKGIDFQFWTVRDSAENDTDDLFATGDPNAPQLLETFVNVQWRVTDPATFYAVMSHSDFYERAAGDTATRTLPIYEMIVQECTKFAVTRTFAIHSLDQILVSDRHEVEDHCRQILQEKLDSLGQQMKLPSSGITVQYLTIKDLHPPYGHPDRLNDPLQPSIGGIPVTTATEIEITPDPNGRSKVSRGPASAFEFVVSMQEFHDQLIALANGEVTAQLRAAEGAAATMKSQAEAYKEDKLARAHADADHLLQITNNTDPRQRKQLLAIMEQRLFYDSIKDILDPVTKVAVDPEAKDIQLYQNTANGPMLMAPQQR